MIICYLLVCYQSVLLKDLVEKIRLTLCPHYVFSYINWDKRFRCVLGDSLTYHVWRNY